jgi:hypothetical protein
MRNRNRRLGAENFIALDIALRDRRLPDRDVVVLFERSQYGAALAALSSIAL